VQKQVLQKSAEVGEPVEGDNTIISGRSGGGGGGWVPLGGGVGGGAAS